MPYGRVWPSSALWPTQGREGIKELLFGAIIRTATAAGLEPVSRLTSRRWMKKASPNSLPIASSRASRAVSCSRLMPGRRAAFATGAKSYFERLSRESGQQYEIADNGDLVVRPGTGKTERMTLFNQLVHAILRNALDGITNARFPPLKTMAVGIVVERSRGASPWVDFLWRPVSALGGAPDTRPWTKLSDDGERATFFAGTADIELYRSEAGNYRENLLVEKPLLWVGRCTRCGHCFTAITSASPQA